MTLLSLVLRRAISAIVIVLLVAGLTGVMLQLLPGNPADLISDLPGHRPFSGAESPWARVASWVAGLARLDLGRSAEHDRPVADLLGERLGRTLLLTISAALLQMALGLGVGLMLALWPGRFRDYLPTTILLALDAVPGFWLGILLIVIFSIHLGWLPAGGVRDSVFGHLSPGAALVDWGRHLLLPVIALGTGGAAMIARLVRGGMLDALLSRPVLMARAAGLPPAKIIRRYALRPILLPLITIVGMSVPSLVGGAVVVEHVFNWQGIGMLATGAVLSRDIPLILTTTLLFALLVTAGNLLADIACNIVDPRSREGVE